MKFENTRSIYTITDNMVNLYVHNIASCNIWDNPDRFLLDANSHIMCQQIQKTFKSFLLYDNLKDKFNW